MNLLTNLWLDEDIRPTNAPSGVKIRLRGSYHASSDLCVIWIGLFINGTELRVYRYHNTITATQLFGNRTDRLFDLNRNKIDGFLAKYLGCDWHVLAQKLAQWSQNPTYRKIIGDIQ